MLFLQFFEYYYAFALYPKRSFIFTSLFTHPLCVFRFTPYVVIKVCSKAFFVLVATANDDILSRSRCS